MSAKLSGVPSGSSTQSVLLQQQQRKDQAASGAWTERRGKPTERWNKLEVSVHWNKLDDSYEWGLRLAAELASS